MADVITPSKARTFALYGAIGLWVSTLFAAITFNVFGYDLRFAFLPFIVLFLWPNGADLDLSFLAMFIGGLSFDVLEGDALGGWSLMFLFFYIVILPFRTGREMGMVESLLNFILWFSILLLGLSLAGFFGILDVNFREVLLTGMATILIFPVVFKFRRSLRSSLVGED